MERFARLDIQNICDREYYEDPSQTDVLPVCAKFLDGYQKYMAKEVQKRSVQLDELQLEEAVQLDELQLEEAAEILELHIHLQEPGALEALLELIMQAQQQLPAELRGE